MIQLRSLGKLWSGIKGAYDELNPATLTGALDVIVIEDRNGEFHCGPFHVRFGKMGAIHPTDKLVEISVNGNQINSLFMRLGKSGYAYFIDDKDSLIPESDSDSIWSENSDDNVGRLLRMRSAEDLTKAKDSTFTCSRRRRRTRKDATISECHNDSSAMKNIDFALKNLEVDSNSPAYMSDSECETSRLMSYGIKDIVPKLSDGNSPVPIYLESVIHSKEDMNSLSVKNHPSMGLNGVYLEDLVTTKYDENVKQNYIYMTNSKDRRSDQYSSQEFNAVDSGYRSDTEHSTNFSAMFNLIRELKLSLCGGLSADAQLDQDKFYGSLVTYEDFSKDPSGIISNPNLVVLLNGKFYNWNMAAPMLLSCICFQTELPYTTITNLEEIHMPKKRYRRKAWFSWGSREPEDKQEETLFIPIHETNALLEVPQVDQIKSEDARKSETEPEKPNRKIKLSSDEVFRLGLKPGANSVEYRIVTKFQGTYTCTANIYLWSSDVQLIVSDVDGTITRSDLLGHVLPLLGHDWTHEGVAELYSNIASNGYQFVYLSARAIGQADLTRSYIKQVLQKNKFKLPDGPILLSPSSLIDAFHREVIQGKPEIFKIECLMEVRNLFEPDSSPFFAAFGNRPNDILAYTKVGFKTCRIFTVNSSGLFRNECLPSESISFKDLIDRTEYLFPSLSLPFILSWEENEDYSQPESDDDDRTSRPVHKTYDTPVDMSVYSSFTFWQACHDTL